MAKYFSLIQAAIPTGLDSLFEPTNRAGQIICGVAKAGEESQIAAFQKAGVREITEAEYLDAVKKKPETFQSWEPFRQVPAAQTSAAALVAKGIEIAQRQPTSAPVPDTPKNEVKVEQIIKAAPIPRRKSQPAQ